MPRTKKRKAAEATIRHRTTMDRMLDRQIMLQVKGVYEEEAGRIVRELAKQFKGRTREAVDMRTITEASRAVRKSAVKSSARVVDEMVDTTKETLAESVHSLARFMTTVRGGASSLDDERVSSRIAKAQRKALETARKEAAVSLSAGIHEVIQDKLRTMAASGAKLRVSDVIATVGETVDDQWWRVERLVRTETSTTFNKAQMLGIETLAQDFNGMLQRWTEMVNDLTGLPMDNRVANDSLVLHGQVALPGDSFHMPAHPLAPSVMVGKSWAHPPNRPNDRAVLTPWLKEWGVPAWRWTGARRINL